jgi:hypothetical protein
MKKMTGTIVIVMLASFLCVKINREQGTTFRYKRPGKLS